jgi:hypothetical protein
MRTLEDCPDDFAELRGVLLREHAWRMEHGLWLQAWRYPTVGAMVCSYVRFPWPRCSFYDRRRGSASRRQASTRFLAQLSIVEHGS